MIKNLLAPAALVGFGVVLSGCVVDAQTADEGDLSASSRSYVTVTRDQRKCPAPSCGGFFVHDVNRATAPRYVADLDLSPADLLPEMEESIREAFPGDLLLRGKLGAIDANGNRSFLVSEVYRGMPGMTPAEGAVFFSAKTSSPVKQCFAAPCNNESAAQLNSTKTTSFTSYDVSDALPNQGDQAWLTSRLQSRGAIAAGKLVKGAHQPGGDETVLEASQVYIRMPDILNSCPKMAQPTCGAGKVATYKRTLDRCNVFDACVKPTICPQYIPACAEGYTQISWPASTSACKQFACDPDFLFQ